MESGGENETASFTDANPSTTAFCESYLQESEHFELSTTIDPSYVIHLIRQLLQPEIVKENSNSTLGRKRVDDIEKRGSQCVERKEEQGTDCDVPFDSIKVKTGGYKANHRNEPLGESLERSNTNLHNERHFIEKSSHRDRQSIESAWNEFTPFFVQSLGGSSQLIKSSNEDGGDQSEEMQQKFLHHTVGPNSLMTEEQGEEAGCVLWDLAANQSHAEFMVENHLLEVLLAILSASHSDRMREICIGILGNLACHGGPGRAMVEIEGLVQKIVQSLFVDDSPSLCELCRLLSVGLHGEEAQIWVKAIESEDVLGRIIWIATNTTNSQLLKKSTVLLLTMVDGQRDAASVLLPHLMHLGLLEVLTDLLSCEIDARTDGMPFHGDLLDILLQIAEVLSLVDEYAAKLASSKKLFSLACEVIRLSGRDEVGPAGIIATVLIANLLAEEEKLICEISYDVTFTQQLLELLPFARDDPGARNALWSILDRICNRHIAQPLEELHSKSEMVSALANGCELLSEDLEEHKGDDVEDPEHKVSAVMSATGSSRNFNFKLNAVSTVAFNK
eukprot:c24272_g1_i3 orf=861-2543(-)